MILPYNISQLKQILLNESKQHRTGFVLFLSQKSHKLCRYSITTVTSWVGVGEPWWVGGVNPKNIMNNIGLDQVRADQDYNLKHILNNEEEDDNDASIYDTIGHTCDYLELEEFTTKVSSDSRAQKSEINWFIFF